MKLLRVLTGKHVGACIELTPGTHRVGADGDCDIALSDWTFAPLLLRIDDKSVSIEWLAAEGEGAAARQTRPLVDFEPREFDGTVLCVGPAEAEWPSDVALLGSVFAATPAHAAPWAAAKTRKRRFAIWGGVAALVAAVSSTAIFATGAKPLPPGPATIEAARAAVQRAADTVAPGHLQASTQQAQIVVTGLVESPAEAEAMHAAIDRARGSFPAVQRFAVATNIMETIRGAVGLTNATVKHVGNGVFSVVGEASDINAARAALDRVAVDLAPTVSKIDATLEQTQSAETRLPILSRLTADGVSVVQTRDGVKHIVVNSVEPSVTVGDVLSLPAPTRAFP